MRKLMFLTAIVAVCLPMFTSPREGHAKTQAVVEIQVTEDGFVPSKVEAAGGKPLTLVFTRRTDQTCATEAVFPSLKRRVALPLNRPVRITVRPRSGQPIEFACGMGMYSGKIVAR